MGGTLTSFDHVISALAKDDMFARFYICFDANGRLPLQVYLLCSLANLLTLPETKEWYGWFDKSDQRHMPFNILTLCYQLKIRFVGALNVRDKSTDLAHDQKIVHALRDIKIWWTQSLTDIERAICAQHMGVHS